MDKKKKTFVVPEAEIVDFSEEDIITLSNGYDADPGFGDEDWGTL